MTLDKFQLDTAAALARIEQKQDDFRREMLAPGGRIPQIEKDIERADTKQWVHTVVVIPITAAIIGLGKKLGVI